MKTRRAILFCILALITYFNSQANQYEISVEYITIQQGLSDNNVNTILKDQLGFIWFGTNDGLNRYDGFSIKQFSPNHKILHILAIYQSPDGRIWIGSTDGLFVFDPKSETFVLHLKQGQDEKVNLLSSRITGIAGNLTDGIIITSSNGLGILNFEKKEINPQKITLKWKLKSGSLPHNKLTCITAGKKNNYWLGTNRNMIIRYNSATDSFSSYKINNQQNSYPIKYINAIYNDDDNLFITTIGGGIIKFNKTSQTTLPVINAVNLSHPDVYAMQFDNHGEMWAGTWDGLDHLTNSFKKKAIHHYNWDHPLFIEKFENRIIAMLADSSGVLWLGTHGGGAVKINLEKRFYKRVPLNSLYEVKGFTVDAMKHLYLATYHGGFKKTKKPINPVKPYEFTNYMTSEKGNRQIPTNIILSTTTDEKGNIWFGTIESNLIKYDPIKDKTSIIQIKPYQTDNWKGRILSLHIDSRGRFWLGTSNGLIYFNRKTNTFYLAKGAPQKKYSLYNNYVRAILEDSKGNLWIGTNRGLNKLIYHQVDSFRFNQFNDLYTSPEILDNKEVWALHEMPDGKLWIGYRSALGCFEEKDGTIRFLNKRDGLCNNFITCLTDNGAQDLWIGTNSGISKLETKSMTFTNYYIANNNRAAFRDHTGHLYFGNNKGFLYFHPDSIIIDSYHTPALITDIRLQNKTVKVGNTSNGNIILSQAAPFTSSIELHYPHNSFTIEYNGLSYLLQQANQYMYKLENHNNEWTTVDGSQRSVTYNNLPAGDYIFKVKAANKDGIWNPKETSLAVTIYPPWYKTWWAKILLLLIIFSLISAIYFIRIKQIYKKQLVENSRKDLKHQLAIAQIEQEKQQEISEMKFRFFMNISHELRTPLTLIMAPIQEVMESKQLPDKIKKKLATANKNAGQLHRLISQLLDLRKIETGRMQLQATKGDIVQFAHSIFESFEQYARFQQINLNFESQQKSISLWFDKSKLETIITNLLSNALKFTPEKGVISLTILKDSDHNNCIISIKDSGPGIPTEEQKHIFDRFYQGSIPTASLVSGTGIGLSLVKNLVDLHKGTITVKSSKGKGATFNVYLPMGKAHLKNNEITSEQTHTALSVAPIIQIDENQLDIKQKRQHPSKSQQILIVEDNKEIREYIRSILEENYKIMEATNGREGLKMTEKHLPSLIISDIMMPIMNGMELCSEIKKDEATCHIPLILLTAKITDQEQLAGLETGADDYITKPFSPKILKARVNNLLASRQRLRTYYSNKVTLTPTNLNLEPKDEKFIRQAIQFVENNLTNPLFNAKILAQELNMSQPTLYRRIKTFTGENIAEFIRSIRLKRAAQLIVSKQYNISEVADMVGFSDPSYFRKCFTKQFSVTPSKYRENNPEVE
ncbi:response regulator [Marinilabiliaceae bacterium JC017]|nr:response regulator [Marinilabiliaceae bacterium JC017]